MNRQQIATLIALSFHLSGFIAIVFFHSTYFISLTAVNLLVCIGLILWTQKELNSNFLAFCILAFIIGFGAEYIGVNKGWLFGHYSYGEPLGPKWNGVPWMIGAQWMMVMYCIGMAMHFIHRKLVIKRLVYEEPTAVDKKAFAKRPVILFFFLPLSMVHLWQCCLIG